MDERSKQITTVNASHAARLDSTRRFSSRVDNYVRYRPGYPPEVLDWLGEHAGLRPDSVVADVGAGTGISARPFLDLGCTVMGIEPNQDMRQAAERFLLAYPRFHAVDGVAEATTLADLSVDLVIAGQAFHWFDPPRAKVEFGRILKPHGTVALMWNVRRTSSTPFLEAYERLLLKFATDYQQVRHENVDVAALSAFYHANDHAQASFANHQLFDWEGLRGRLLSSSYAPAPGETGHDAMMASLREAFERFQEAGQVSFDYDTQLYAGRVAAPIT